MPGLAVVTVSDRCAAGQQQDTTGPALARLLSERWPEETIGRGLVPDNEDAIVTLLHELCHQEADLILTTGGTGLTARDVTPEGTRAILDKEAPGIAEALRYTSYPKLPRAALSRGTAGVRGKTLIINLPGSPGGVRDGLEVLSALVEHAVELVRGERTEH